MVQMIILQGKNRDTDIQHLKSLLPFVLPSLVQLYSEVSFPFCSSLSKTCPATFNQSLVNNLSLTSWTGPLFHVAYKTLY